MKSAKEEAGQRKLPAVTPAAMEAEEMPFIMPRHEALLAEARRQVNELTDAELETTEYYRQFRESHPVDVPAEEPYSHDQFLAEAR